MTRAGQYDDREAGEIAKAMATINAVELWNGQRFIERYEVGKA